MIHSIDHVNIVVDDLEAMTAFYRDVLGFTVTKDVRISGDWVDRVANLKGVNARVIYLNLAAGPRLELIQYDSPVAKRPPHLEMPNLPGMRHMAFTVDDLDALMKKLSSRGVKFVSPVQQVPDAQVTYSGGVRKRLVYFHDPEGNLLELCEYR